MNVLVRTCSRYIDIDDAMTSYNYTCMVVC